VLAILPPVSALVIPNVIKKSTNRIICGKCTLEEKVLCTYYIQMSLFKSMDTTVPFVMVYGELTQHFFLVFIIGGLACIAIFFSLLLSIFRSKYHGYPYRYSFIIH
jgi:heme/copper-type cytochrome/quinol oxidase subunit 4